MIERYTRPEMGNLWKEEVRFQCLLEVEIAVAEVQAQFGIIPRASAKAIKQKGAFDVNRIREIESVTKHDVIAFVSSVAEKVGPHGRFIHFGMTSSDVLDTALSLQIRGAGEVLSQSLRSFLKELGKLAKKESATLCAGRTHGMWAEPTTFGFKLAGFYAEQKRNLARLELALKQACVVKLSGAVGTYSSQDEKVEKALAKKLKMPQETIATQVVPRDRHAELMWAIAMVGSGLERMAVEFRHLQRSEVAEVIEGFTPGQKGSSAMPHKKNPISAENVTGLSRLLRGYAQAAQENIPLWHERDISHSSVERVILADAFIVLDYALSRMEKLLAGLFVDRQRMLENMERSQGQIFSSQALLVLVRHGWSREDAYKVVQAHCHQLRPSEHLMTRLIQDPLLKRIPKVEWVGIFRGEKVKKTVAPLIKKVVK